MAFKRGPEGLAHKIIGPPRKHRKPVAYRAEIVDHWAAMDGNRQFRELQERRAADRARLNLGRSKDAEDEREAWAALARAKRAETQEERDRERQHRRPGEGITGFFGGEPRSFPESLPASPDAGQRFDAARYLGAVDD